MTAHGTQKHRQKTAFCAFALAAFSCLLGLSFCLIKSPQSRADAYVVAAVTAMAAHNDIQAAQAALEAVRLDPMQLQGWQILSEMLHKRGDENAAAQARVIASRVQQNPAAVPPVYAMPAEFKLSLLALAETQIP